MRKRKLLPQPLSKISYDDEDDDGDGDIDEGDNGSPPARLDPEEEEALASASLKDIMALADILNTNPQVSKIMIIMTILMMIIKMIKTIRRTS